MLGVFKRVWAAIKALPWDRSDDDEDEVWPHGSGCGSNGSHYGAQQHSEPIRGPKNDWGARSGPGF